MEITTGAFVIAQWAVSQQIVSMRSADGN
jgi:hypothetical protein